jgi:hypothetical protein
LQRYWLQQILLNQEAFQHDFFSVKKLVCSVKKGPLQGVLKNFSVTYNSPVMHCVKYKSPAFLSARQDTVVETLCGNRFSEAKKKERQNTRTKDLSKAGYTATLQMHTNE